MGIVFDLGTILTGILVFLARIADVSLGTMRTISIIYGRTKIAFFLGFVEVSIWLVVITTVINRIKGKPILGVFYALGFATGNVIGIMLERRLAFGNIVVRIISPQSGTKMARHLRKKGYVVTTFEGQGMAGPVNMLYIVSRRKDLGDIMCTIKEIDPNAFYITEQAGVVSKIYRPFMSQRTWWREILKMK